MNTIEASIKDLLQRNTKFVIASLPHATEDVLLAREALRGILFSLGKEVIVFPEIPLALQEKWKNILPPTSEPIRQNLTIAISKEKIREVRYEEREGNAMFIITPKGRAAATDVSISMQKPEGEAAFLFFEDTDPFFSHLNENVALLPEKGNMVFLLGNNRTLAEKVYDIARYADAEQRTAACATLLYFSLVLQTNNFQQTVTPGIFNLAKVLLEEGADKNALAEIQEKQKHMPTTHLLGRALARTQIDNARNASWTFLTQKDFQKSGIVPEQNEAAASALISHVRSHIPAVPVSFLLWEKNPHVHFCVWSNDATIVARLARALAVPQEGNACKGGGFQNFTQAELKLREALKNC